MKEVDMRGVLQQKRAKQVRQKTNMKQEVSKMQAMCSSETSVYL
jgi:hypothetical protein